MMFTGRERKLQGSMKNTGLNKLKTKSVFFNKSVDPLLQFTIPSNKLQPLKGYKS